jgi:hypothetical protein
MLFRSNRARILFIVLAIVWVILTLNISNALALDQSACFGQNWFGDENECIGRLELSDLGSFDASGDWQWNITDPDLLADIALNVITGDNGKDNWGPGGGLTPVSAVDSGRVGIQINWGVLRNRVHPEGDYPIHDPEASIMLQGFVDPVMVPVVWKLRYIEGDAYWFWVQHVYNQQAIDDCNAQSWQFEPGDGSPCEQWHIEDKDPLWSLNPDTLVYRMDEGYMFYDEGELSSANIESITWNEKTRTVGIKGDDLEWGIYMNYDMGQNILQETGKGASRTVYFDTFGEDLGPALIGFHTFTLKLKDGRTETFTREVVSNRLMPVVPSTRTENTVNITTKSGKVISAGQTAEVANITAREITDEDGKTRLLIQWAEPDLAMTFSEYKRNVLLRIWVGNNWLTPSPTDNAYFLWCDVPVTSGSVVIPPDQYAWVKAQVLANGENQLQISGQYREQFSGYHNRGYLGVVYFPIN